MPYDWKTELPGIYARHADSCTRREGGVCICGPLGYRAAFTDPSSGRRTLSPDFENVADAQAWLGEQQAAARAAAEPDTGAREIGAVVNQFLDAAEQGRVDRRPGEPYTFESLRDLRSALSYVDYELRAMDVKDVRRRDVQKLVDDLRSAGLPPARVLSVVDALRALYAFAIQQDLVDHSPVVELGLPFEGFATELQTPWGTQAVPAPAPAQAPAWAAAPPPVAAAPQIQHDATGHFPGSAGPVTQGTPWSNGSFPGAPPWSPVTPSGGTPAVGTPWNGGYNGTSGWYPPAAPGAQTVAVGTAQAEYDATMQERLLWWIVRIVVIVFVLIALVLAAESV